MEGTTQRKIKLSQFFSLIAGSCFIEILVPDVIATCK